MIFQTNQLLFIVTGEDTFAGTEVDSLREIIDTDHTHIVQGCFFLHMLVVGFVGQDIIFMVSENGKVVFLCFLVQIGQHFRIDTFFKKQFTSLYIDDLSTVI